MKGQEVKIKHFDDYWEISYISNIEQKLFYWEKEHHIEFYNKYGKGIYLIFDYTIIGVYNNVEDALKVVQHLKLNNKAYILMINTGTYWDYQIIPGYDDIYYILGNWINPISWWKMTAYNITTSLENRTVTYEFKEHVDRIITDINISGPDGGYIPCRALWDTGATCCGITHRLIENMNLVPIEKDVDLKTSAGNTTTDVYLTGVLISGLASISGLKTIRQEIDDCDFVIGMNFISQGDFVIKNINGKTAVSFTYPPQYILNEIKNKQIY